MLVYPIRAMDCTPSRKSFLSLKDLQSSRTPRLEKLHIFFQVGITGHHPSQKLAFILQKIIEPFSSDQIFQSLIVMEELNLSTQIVERDYETIFILNWKCSKDTPEIAAFFSGGLELASREDNLNSLKFGVFGGPIERACAKISIHNDIISYISCRVYRGSQGILSTNQSPPMKLPRVKNPKDRAFFEWYWSTYEEKVRETKDFQMPMVWVQTLCTDPVWQCHGAATMLMMWCMDFAKKEGLHRCVLCASPFAAEIGFYEKFGFRKTGLIELVNKTIFPTRMGTSEVVMVKDL